MNDWTAGYIANIGYTYGYYRELNPLRMRLAFLNAGLLPPEQGSHCELGFGQGLSVNIHAAASCNTWYGNDFNPGQAGFAKSLAQAAGAQAHLTDESFADFCNRTDLPDFDSIGLHGIWSWISDENRAIIVEFARRKLKVGGVLYVSYNTLPGWAAFSPIRHLMTEHAKIMGASGQGIISRIDDALSFTDKLLGTNPNYNVANPLIAERFSTIRDKDRQYLAHEYFNHDWHPMHFSAMAAWMQEAKLSFACSAHYIDYVDSLNLTTAQQVLLREIPDVCFRETVRDFMVNQQFRRDYWVKGARKLSLLEQAEAVRADRFILIQQRPEVSLKVSGAIGEAVMQESIYAPILDALADHEPKTLGMVEQIVKKAGVNFAQVVQAIVVLVGSGSVYPAQDDSVVARASVYTDKLNSYLIDKARGSSDIGLLASPIIGGGVSVNRIPQLFLLALSEGKQQPVEWAQAVWKILMEQGQLLSKDGKILKTPEENMAELSVQAKSFSENQLPILRALQIA